MLNRITLTLLACGALALSACSSGALTTRSAAKAQDNVVDTRCDYSEAGPTGEMRFYVAGTQLSSAEWTIDGKTYLSTAPNGEVYFTHDHPGSVQASFRGVDKDGKDCTGPRVKFNVRTNAPNNPPVVTSFGGPTDAGEGFERGSDGTLRKYHEWRWTNAQGYDPEEIEVNSWQWGVYDGGDLDGDGLPDRLLAGENADGSVFTKDPEQIEVIPSDGPHTFTVRVYQLTADVEQAQIEVTVTDAAAKPRKWGDGHVTLMK